MTKVKVLFRETRGEKHKEGYVEVEEHPIPNLKDKKND